MNKTQPAAPNARAAITNVLKTALPVGRWEVLEAGCGSLTQLKLDDIRVTGIDISEKQLGRHGGLDEAIVGDIQSYPLAARSFDLIICWDVLEHLPHPERALEHFAEAAREGGAIVLAFPNLLSIKGIVTKWTPHAFHVWAYRNIWGVRDAGTEDRAPFKTYLHPSIAPHRIRAFARDRGLNMLLDFTYEGGMQRQLRRRNALWNAPFAIGGALGKLLSLGRLDVNHTECAFVLQKPPAKDARAG